MKNAARIGGFQWSAYAFIAALVFGFGFIPGAHDRPAEAAVITGAVAGAVEGDAEIFQQGVEQPQKVSKGSGIAAWDTARTGAKSRLLLQWNDGPTTSQGELSSIFVSLEQREGGQVFNFNVTEGIVRVATGQPGGGRLHPYLVTTPTASIQPENLLQPVDFIVETYDPATTVVTVIKGRVKVTNLRVGPAGQKDVQACETVYVELAKDSPDLLPAAAEDLSRLVGASTISGTMFADLGACSSALAAQPGPSPRPAPPPARTYEYPAEPDYYVEESDGYDFYPYSEIVVMPSRGPGHGCVVMLPGIGEFVIPLDVFGGWAVDPSIVQLYAGYYFVERALFFDRDHCHDLIRRRRALYDTMYYAQLARNPTLLSQARHELDYLNVRINWAERRIRRLESRVASLENDQQRFGGRLPRNVNLYQAVSNSINSGGNVHILQKFQNRFKENVQIQNGLVNIAGQELVRRRTGLASERDPQNRLKLRDDFVRVRGDIRDGKLPLSAKQSDVKELVTALSREKDPAKHEKIQEQLIGQLKKTDSARPPEVLDPAKLESLQKQIVNFPNPEKRPDLEKRFGELQRSVEARKETEAGREKIIELTNQAAKEKDPAKQQELLGKLKDWSVPLAVGAGAGALGALHLRENKRTVEHQLADEKDVAKKAALQQSLDDLKKKEAEQARVEQERARERQLMQDEQRRRQTDMQRVREEELKKQGALTGQQEDPRKQELEKQLLERKKAQEERERQVQQRRLEQEQRLPQAEQQRRRQEEQERAQQMDLQRRQDAGKQQELLQQQDRNRKAEQDKLEQERKKQSDQQRLQGDEGRRQAELLKKQEEEGTRDLRRREEQANQEQLKRQQEQARQEQLKRQQEDQKRQQEQAQQEQRRRQQEQAQQEQLKRQQEQQGRQQEQARQEQLKRQQEQAQQEQLKRQQDQQRRQQEQAQQQQLRQQQEQQRRQQEQAQQQQLRQQQEQQRRQQEQARQQQEQQRRQQEQASREAARQKQLLDQKLKEEEEKKRRR